MLRTDKHPRPQELGSLGVLVDVVFRDFRQGGIDFLRSSASVTSSTKRTVARLATRSWDRRARKVMKEYKGILALDARPIYRSVHIDSGDGT